VTHGIQLLQELMLRRGTNQGWELLVLGGNRRRIVFLLTSLTVRRIYAQQPELHQRIRPLCSI